MNREIKFRGKRIDNGEWVYGDLIQGDKVFIVIDTEINDYYGDGSELYSTDWYEVIPETVGQYTGLKDKNGKDIYEGDIIKNTLGHLEKIVFNNGCFQAASIKHPNANLYLLSSYNDYIEIIGSIFENPKLLEVENEQK